MTAWACWWSHRGAPLQLIFLDAIAFWSTVQWSSRILGMGLQLGNAYEYRSAVFEDLCCLKQCWMVAFLLAISRQSTGIHWACRSHESPSVHSRSRFGLFLQTSHVWDLWFRAQKFDFCGQLKSMPTGPCRVLAGSSCLWQFMWRITHIQTRSDGLELVSIYSCTHDPLEWRSGHFRLR